jgi:hypothetical protein
MGFVGQLDFAALAAVHQGSLEELPADSVLALFCDLEEEPFGFDSRRRFEGTGLRKVLGVRADDQLRTEAARMVTMPDGRVK